MTSLLRRETKTIDEVFIDRLNVSKLLFLKVEQYRPATYFEYKSQLSAPIIKKILLMVIKLKMVLNDQTQNSKKS